MPFNLLVCTVGGTPEPLVAAIKHWRPERIHFLPSPETKGQIEEKISPLALQEDFALTPGRYDVRTIPDSQDFGVCMKAMRKCLPEVKAWLARGDDYQVVFDFTGGTKCMTAALALIHFSAQRPKHPPPLRHPIAPVARGNCQKGPTRPFQPGADR